MESLLKIKHFDFLKLIGSGGMAEVYQAWDNKLNRHVAIKVIETKNKTNIAKKRFISEARVLAQLNHPNITHVHDIFKENTNYYIVMEFLEGQDLGEYIKTNEISGEDLITYFMDLADAFEDVHQKGILHRDIKPSNLFITKNKKIKIIDFGISKWDSDPNSVETEKNFFVGSLLYTAPEVMGAAGQSVSSDIYAFGLTLLYCLTGQHYFEGKSVPDILARIAHEQVNIPENIKNNLPAELIELIQFLVEKDPQDRLTSMMEVKEKLKDIYQKMPNTVSTRTLQKFVEHSKKSAQKPKRKKKNQGQNKLNFMNVFFKNFGTLALLLLVIFFSLKKFLPDFFTEKKISQSHNLNDKSNNEHNLTISSMKVSAFDTSQQPELAESLRKLAEQTKIADNKKITYPFIKNNTLININKNIEGKNWQEALRLSQQAVVILTRKNQFQMQNKNFHFNKQRYPANNNEKK